MQAIALPGRRPAGALSISPMAILSAILLALMAVLLLYPLLATVVRVIGEAGTGTEVLGPGGIDSSLATVLANTAIVVVAGGALALAIGSGLSWINERTDATLGWLADILPLAPLMVPPIAGVIGWVVLLDPRA